MPSGMVLDIFVIGVLVLWLNQLGQRHLDVRRYEDEIDDFRGWESEEASHRIAGNIRRISRLGKPAISLAFCCLAEANLRNANLKGASLMNANLQGAVLNDAYIQGAVLNNANLQEANLLFANLQGAVLSKANLQEAKLLLANLEGTTLSSANLRGADLQGAKGLTLEQLSTVKTLYEAKLDDDLLAEVKEHFPHLLEEPKD